MEYPGSFRSFIPNILPKSTLLVPVLAALDYRQAAMLPTNILHLLAGTCSLHGISSCQKPKLVQPSVAWQRPHDRTGVRSLLVG